MSYLLAETSHGKVSYRRLGNGPRKILFFHGFPGSSKQIDIFKNEVEKLGLDVLCFDRPGYYHTEIKTSDTLSVTTDIAMELVSMLGWTDFEIVTVSGGTPFGITIGLLPRLQHRLTV
ncbi:MAG: alpha/beta hydrolase [Bdellovibrionaceae bacterium]|nr:alpha/beta hydrolase [Pseudobdellovibrionaceae bacterium]